MTTSAIGRSDRFARSASSSAGGYTLLEICIVLFILALLAGAAVPSLASWLSEERLRGPARQLELLARSARLAAIESQAPCDVVIHPDSLSFEQPGAKESALPAAYPVPDSVTVLVQGWGEGKFSNRPEVRWRFQPSGLCEPIRVKFQQGGSEIELAFNPLTAAVAEETYEFR